MRGSTRRKVEAGEPNIVTWGDSNSRSALIEVGAVSGTRTGAAGLAAHCKHSTIFDSRFRGGIRTPHENTRFRTALPGAFVQAATLPIRCHTEPRTRGPVRPVWHVLTQFNSHWLSAVKGGLSGVPTSWKRPTHREGGPSFALEGGAFPERD